MFYCAFDDGGRAVQSVQGCLRDDKTGDSRIFRSLSPSIEHTGRTKPHDSDDALRINPNHNTYIEDVSQTHTRASTKKTMKLSNKSGNSFLSIVCVCACGTHRNASTK